MELVLGHDGAQDATKDRGSLEGVSAGLAVAFLVRSMGNGVDRIEGARQVAIGDAMRWAGGEECERVTRDSYSRIADAVDVALDALGLSYLRLPDMVMDGYVRAVSDQAFDVVAWFNTLL